MTTENKFSNRPIHTLKISLYPETKNKRGTDIVIAIVAINSKLTVVVAATYLYDVFTPKSSVNDWVLSHIETNSLLLGIDYLISPHNQIFFTIAGLKVLAMMENNDKTTDMLEWLTGLETRIAPIHFGIVADVLKGMGNETLH